jgi:hypothetical protein
MKPTCSYLPVALLSLAMSSATTLSATAPLLRRGKLSARNGASMEGGIRMLQQQTCYDASGPIDCGSPSLMCEPDSSVCQGTSSEATTYGDQTCIQGAQNGAYSVSGPWSSPNNCPWQVQCCTEGNGEEAASADVAAAADVADLVRTLQQQRTCYDASGWIECGDPVLSCNPSTISCHGNSSDATTYGSKNCIPGVQNGAYVVSGPWADCPWQVQCCVELTREERAPTSDVNAADARHKRELQSLYPRE